MAESEVDTERVSVRTYVPAYQRDAWDEHAERLDMSRSEFVRTMVQAGREFFDETAAQDESGSAGSDTDGTSAAAEHSAGTATGGSGPGADGQRASSAGETGAAGPQQRGGELEDQVISALAADEYLSWEELVAVVTDDIETRLESALQSLQAADEVRYSGPNGGYTLDEQ